jgi:hypothetical protein
MMDSTIEERLRAAIEELTVATPLLHPDAPASDHLPSRTGAVQVSTESDTDSALSVEDTTTDPTSRAPWLDVKVLALVVSVLLLVAGAFLLNHLLSSHQSVPSTHTTVTTTPPTTRSTTAPTTPASAAAAAAAARAATERAAAAAAEKLVVMPSSGLTNGQMVTVSVTGFPPGKARLSECAAVSDANGHGCGIQSAAQPFVVIDGSAGSASFVVSGEASSAPLSGGQLVPCTQCVLVATDSNNGFVSVPIAFLH